MGELRRRYQPRQATEIAFGGNLFYKQVGIGVVTIAQIKNSSESILAMRKMLFAGGCHGHKPKTSRVIVARRP